jgi:predicted RNase H-like HicB family nuclease
MRQVTIVYHYEDGNWWADSPDPDLTTFIAGGRSLEETRRLAHEGAEFHLNEDVTVIELFEPAHVMTSLEISHSEALPVVVYGAPAPSGSPRTTVDLRPSQLGAVGSR